MQYSYWVIPFFRNVSWLNVLLVKHVAGHWSFPKWHIEAGELPLDTAKRELFEETGISNVNLYGDLCFETQYAFCDAQGKKIDKKVGFFVWEVYDELIVLQQEELCDFRRVDSHLVNDLLTFECDKNVFGQAYEWLQYNMV